MWKLERMISQNALIFKRFDFSCLHCFRNMFVSNGLKWWATSAYTVFIQIPRIWQTPPSTTAPAWLAWIGDTASKHMYTCIHVVISMYLFIHAYISTFKYTSIYAVDCVCFRTALYTASMNVYPKRIHGAFGAKASTRPWMSASEPALRHVYVHGDHWSIRKHSYIHIYSVRWIW